VTDGSCRLFYMCLREGSLTKDSTSTLTQTVSSQMAETMKLVEGTSKIVQVSHVQPVTFCGLTMEVLFMGADVITDILQIINAFMDELHVVGSIFLFIFVSSITAQLFGCAREGCNFLEEFRQSLRRGVKTNLFLKFVDREKGFEAFVSLALSCYCVHWQVEPRSCIVSFVSIIFSGWGVASYIFDTVFVEHPADRMMQGWRLGLGGQGLSDQMDTM